MIGIGISLILDYNSSSFAMFPGALRILIFAFQTISSRFAGLQTIDLNRFAAGTLLIYLVLMIIKPQMLCALDKAPFELEWQAIRDGTIFNNVDEFSSSTESDDSDVLLIQYVHRLLTRRSSKARLRAKQYFATKPSIYNAKSRKVFWLKTRLFFFVLFHRLFSHAFTLLTRTYTWLFIAIFLVCCFESHHITPIDENITVIKIVFDVVSAFGTSGLTTGYPNLTSSFCTIFTVPSKIIVILTMLMGRHRGLFASMKDQEKIEYSAHDLLTRWQQMARDKWPLSSSSLPRRMPPRVPPRIRRSKPVIARIISQISSNSSNNNK